MMDLVRGLRRRGLVGPRYSGIAGRLRLLFQEMVIRTDVVLVARPGDPRPQRPGQLELQLRWVRSWDEFAPFVPEIDAAYHRGYGERWRQAFLGGETLILGMSRNKVVGFGWLQMGTRQGTLCPYAPLFDDEYRILRVGVLPQYRRQGVNSVFYWEVLSALFSRGASRVFVDCTADNIPSLHAQARAGFLTLGRLRVCGRLLGSRALWWLLR